VTRVDPPEVRRAQGVAMSDEHDTVEPVEVDAQAEAERQQRQYALHAEWVADQWDSMRDDEELLVSMGALRVFLRGRLFDALSEPLLPLSEDSPSEGEEDV